MAASLVCAVASGCGGGGGDSQDRPDADVVDETFDRRAMLAHLADHLWIPTYDQFATDAAALVSSLETHCQALASGPNDTTLTATRAAWAAAMDTWEIADAVSVGPAAASDNALRNRIYAWPLVAPCAIDTDVAVRWNSPESYDVTTRFDNARSLAAIEFLLYPAGSAHNCVAAPTGWDALGTELPRARCALAASIAVDVAAQGAALAAAWRTGGGDYRTQLVTAGTAESAIVSEREAVNMVSDGLFYVDKMVKDMKVGEAAGFTINACGEVDAPCLREVEHRYADRASYALRINLRALRVAFTGTTVGGDDGPGFEDYLIAVGATELAGRMTASIDAAVAAADALPDGYIAALSDQRELVLALHDATRAITDDLKSQFLTVLGLDIPDDVAGDND